MSDAFWMSFFSFLIALLGAVVSWLNRQKLQNVEKKVDEVQKTTLANGKQNGHEGQV